MKAWTLTALVALLVFMVAGCGVVSGTVFVKQDIDDTLQARSVPGPLDENILVGAVVDLTDNSDLDRVDVDGIEDLCVVMHAHNSLADTVQGEVWVTPDTSGFIPTSIADLQAHNGFPIFRGVALLPNEDRIFTCAQTLALFENLDRLAELVASPKYFKVWASAAVGPYDFEFSNIHLGMHVTGSL